VSADFRLNSITNQGHVSIPHDSALVSASWTLMGWVYHRGGSAARPIYTGAYDGTNLRVRHALAYGDGSSNFWVGFDSPGWTRAVDTGSAILDEWVFYMGTYDTSNLKLYRGYAGTFELRATTASAAGTPDTGSVGSYIGTRWDAPGDQGIDGTLAEVAMFPSALSLSDGTAIYDARDSASSTRSAVMSRSPSGYWRLRDIPGANVDGSGQDYAVDEAATANGTYYFTEYRSDPSDWDHRLNGSEGPIAPGRQEGWGMLI
jgi:hypothetical protein